LILVAFWKIRQPLPIEGKFAGAMGCLQLHGVAYRSFIDAALRPPRRQVVADSPQNLK